MNICKEHKSNCPVMIFPDYSSSAIWCAKCGISFCNPKYSHPAIPDDIISLLEGWNMLWDLASHHKGLNHDRMAERIKENGKTLAKLVNEYVPCILSEERLFYLPMWKD